MMSLLSETMPSTSGRRNAASRAAGVGLPIYVKLILLSLFLPEDLSFFVAGLRMTVTRLLFLALTPLVLSRFASKVNSGRYVFVASDAFVPLASIWIFLGPAVSTGIADSLAHSGPIVVEYLIGYLSMRVLLDQDGQGAACASLLCTCICVVALDAVLDPVAGSYITHETLASVTGLLVVAPINEDSFRFGLLRAAGPLEHPILLGLTCMVGMLIAVSVRMPRRPFRAVICGIGVLVSFSSAPLQSTLTGLGLLAFGRILSGVAGKWRYLSAVSGCAVALVLMAVPSPFGHLIEAVTIDPQTGYWRLMQWNLLGPIVLDNQFFGVSQQNVDATEIGSIDSLWLVLALLYGMPASVFTGLGMLGACSLPTSGPKAKLTTPERQLGRVLGILMFLIILAGVTVHIWGPPWIMIAMLSGLRAHLGERGALNAARQRKLTATRLADSPVS